MTAEKFRSRVLHPRAEIILSLRLALLTAVRDSAICDLPSNEKKSIFLLRQVERDRFA